MRSSTRRTHLGWQKILDIKTSTLTSLRQANAVADASTAQKARRRKPSRHQMDTKLEGSTLMRSGKGSTTTRFVCSPKSFTEAWGSYCSGRLVGVSDASPDSGFLSPNIHSCMHACMHACIHSLVGVSGAPRHTESTHL